MEQPSRVGNNQENKKYRVRLPGGCRHELVSFPRYHQKQGQNPQPVECTNLYTRRCIDVYFGLLEYLQLELLRIIIPREYAASC